MLRVGERKRRSVLQSVRADSDRMRKPPELDAIKNEHLRKDRGLKMHTQALILWQYIQSSLFSYKYLTSGSSARRQR